jgi:hypothetical protein
MDAIFFAGNALGRLALLDIVDLDRLVVACCNQKVSLIIEIQRRYVRLGIGICASTECLENVTTKSVTCWAGGKGGCAGSPPLMRDSF